MDFFQKKSNKILLGVSITLILIIVVLLFTDYSQKRDKTLQAALSNISTISSYSQQVETETIESGRKIQVSGTYHIDRQRNKFYSLSTTTLFVPDDTGDLQNHSFTLENISIANVVYTKITTESEMLAKTIPVTEKWERFIAGSIPPKFNNIAIAGPVVDNARLFAKKGGYLKVLDEPGEDVIDGRPHMRYVFALKEESFSSEGSLDLGTIPQRIGREGTAEAWVDNETRQITKIILKNAPYVSETRLSNHGSPPPILAPKI